MTTQEHNVLGRKPTEAKWEPLILSDLASMQDFVGGNIERIELPMEIDLWVNEEFLFIEEEVSVLLCYRDERGYMQVVKGNVFLSGTDAEGEFASLTNEQKVWIKENSRMVRYKPDLIPVCMFDLREGGF